MNFRSISDLQSTIIRASPLTRDFEVVVGIPRSGLLAASMLSLFANKPLADLDGFVNGKLLAAGRTKTSDQFVRSLDGVRKVLILDDSIANGFAMKEARARTKHLHKRYDITFAAVYGERRVHPEADVVFEVVRQPRLFQWNVMHHALLEKACVDIDGILCPDPTAVQNDDGPLYAAFLQEANVLHVPTRPIGHLVTNRIEKYRASTVAWLQSQGIDYGQLHMNDAESAVERRAQPVGAFKSRVYREIGAPLFIESEVAQADAIAALSGRPVLCTETWQIHAGDGAIVVARQRLSEIGHRTTTLPKKAKIRAKNIIHSVLGQTGIDKLKSLVRR